MGNRIDLLLNEFAGRHEGTRVVVDEQDNPVLVVDERWAVCFIDDALSGHMRAFADITRVAPSDAPADPGQDEWVSETRTVDEFEWSIACHVESGSMVLSAAVASAANGGAFDAWLECFLQRLRPMAAVA